MFLASKESHILIYQGIGFKVFWGVLWRGSNLGLVPVTGDLFQELHTRLGREEADRLDATSQYSTYPSLSSGGGVRLWGAHTRRKTTIAYISASEYGESSHGRAALWSDGKEILAGVDMERCFATSVIRWESI